MIAAIRLVILLAAVAFSGLAAAQEAQHPYHDWALRCPQQGGCVLEQRVFVEGVGKQPLVQAIFQESGKSRVATLALLVPLGVLLPDGLRLRVDQGAPLVIPFHHCRTQGCLALTSLTPELRRALEGGREARVDFATLDGRRVGVPVSLQGVTAGLRAWDQSAEQGGAKNE